MRDIKCPICTHTLSVRYIRGRKSNKPFIMLKCDKDGRHFRGFITDQDYVNRLLGEKKANGSGMGMGTESR